MIIKYEPSASLGILFFSSGINQGREGGEVKNEGESLIFRDDASLIVKKKPAARQAIACSLDRSATSFMYGER